MENNLKANSRLKIEYVPIEVLKPFENNPRTATKEQIDQIKKSLREFGTVVPLLVNSAPGKENIVIGGNLRLRVLKELSIKKVPVTYVPITDSEREKELNIRLNKNTGDWDWDLLAEFGETMLSDIGFSSEELDDIFDIEDTPEQFDLKKELEKLDITKINIQKGDIWQLGNNRLMCGDSTIEQDILELMGEEKADMCFTDEPYLLEYTRGKKRRGKATEGFGYKRDRRYLETESLPPDFMARWMVNVNKIQKEDFSIISFENWKNLPQMWEEMSKYWRIRNLIIWHLPNRVQGFAAKHRFFNKYDIALLGTSPSDKSNLNLRTETELIQNEYEAAIYATSGKPHWEPYGRGKKFCPTDFVEFVASDEKNSGQGIVFGTKPIEILIPYIKVLTKRGDLIVEPFGGSGSTLIAAEKLKRRCYLMEKSNVYCEVIKNRWEKLTGQKAVKIS